MIAQPPGRRSTGGEVAILSPIVYVAGLLTGAAILAGVAWVVGALLRPPVLLVSAVTVLSAIAVATGRDLERRRPLFQVPLSWSRFGLPLYATLFGLLLGVGVVTAFPGLGLVVLVTWAFVSKSLAMAVLPFLAFAVGRAGPGLQTTVIAWRRGQHPAEALRGIRTVALALRWVESAILIAVGLLLIWSA